MSKKKDESRGIKLYIDGKEIPPSVAEIKKELRILQKEWEKLDEGTEEYVATTKKIKTLKTVLADHKSRLQNVRKEQTSMLSKGVGLFNTYAASAMAAVAAITGIVLKLNEFRKLSNEREEAKADVKALTGLEDDDIQWLEQNAIQLSTTVSQQGIRIRQSASEILEAYKLVGSAKPELLSNREALAEVTEQTLILASASGMKLTDAVDAVTLSMNQYGAASDEAARYTNVMAAGSKYGAASVESVTEAISKSGVSAASAGIPIEQLVGTIETLAEKGIKDEIAGTGLKKFFLTLQTGANDTNPKVVGLQKALENLAKKQLSATAVKKQFGEEGYNVASVLINEADKVKAYTESVTDTGVAIEQAAIKSETLAAKLDQTRNQLKEQGIILIQELNPAITSTLNKIASLSKYTVSLVRLISEHRVALTTLIAAIVIYNGWIHRKIILDKLQIFWNKGLIASFKALGIAMKANPWILVASVIAVAIAALIDYQREQNKVTQAMRSSANIAKKTAEEYDKEAAKIDRLTATVQNNKLAIHQRREALNELKKIIPGYHAQLSEEGLLTNHNTRAIREYLVQLEKEIKLKAAKEELEELYRKRRTLDRDVKTETKRIDSHKKQETSSHVIQGSTWGLRAYDISQTMNSEKWERVRLEKLKKEQSQNDDAIKELEKEMEQRTPITPTPKPVLDTAAPDTGGSSKSTETAKQKRIKKELSKIETEFLKKQTELKKKYLESETMTQQDFAAQMEQLELEKLNQLMTVAGLEPKKREEFQAKILDAKIKLSEQIKAIDERSTADEQQKQQEERRKIEHERDQEIGILDRSLKMELITIEKYNELKKKVEEEATIKRREATEQEADRLLSIEEKKLELKHLALRRSLITGQMTEEQYNALQRDSMKNFLEDMLRDLKLSAEKRAEILKEINELELNEEEEKFEKLKEKNQSYVDLVQDMASGISDAMLDAFSGKDDALKQALKTMLLTTIDAIEAYVQLAYVSTLVKSIISGGVGLIPGLAKLAAIKVSFALAKGLVNNFYDGGFTPSGKWDDPQGIVHSDEFVANRFAVANPHVRPVLDLIDYAQRTGNIGNLSQTDIAAVATGNSSSSATHSNMPVNTTGSPSVDSAEMLFILHRLEQTMQDATRAYQKPSPAFCWVSGKGGVNEAKKLEDKIKANALR